MFTEKVSYEVVRVELYGHDPRLLAYKIESQFARGNQTQVSTEVRVTKQQVFTTPATATDWLKQVIIEWEPTLKFGWLRPRLRAVTVDVETCQENTYYNVVPMAMDEGRERLYITKFGRAPIAISGESWLDMDPCTAEDIARTRDEERKLARNEQAW